MALGKSRCPLHSIARANWYGLFLSLCKKGWLKMKRKLIIAVGIPLLIFALVGFMLVGHATTPKPFTYGDCINELKPYLTEHGLDEKVFGTDEALKFVNHMLFEPSDTYMAHPHYIEIGDFLAKYRSLYLDYILCRDNFEISVAAGEELYNSFKGNNPCLDYNPETHELRFVFTEEFLKTEA